ncbi:MAG: GNAT family N-acetyltransferase, partial [Myxococcales bacterium]|nr:GNAT family N-acetyltransferase [Myxococcales bacterium]
LWQTLSLAEQHAGAVGAREAALHVARGNDGARALFEQLGFVRDPAADTTYPSGVPGLRMVRPLEGTAALVLETA